MCCEAEMAAQSLHGRWMHGTKLAEFLLKNAEPVSLSYCHFCALDEALSTLVSGSYWVRSQKNESREENYLPEYKSLGNNSCHSYPLKRH